MERKERATKEEVWRASSRNSLVSTPGMEILSSFRICFRKALFTAGFFFFFFMKSWTAEKLAESASPLFSGLLPVASPAPSLVERLLCRYFSPALYIATPEAQASTVRLALRRKSILSGSCSGTGSSSS